MLYVAQKHIEIISCLQLNHTLCTEQLTVCNKQYKDRAHSIQLYNIHMLSVHKVIACEIWPPSLPALCLHPLSPPSLPSSSLPTFPAFAFPLLSFPPSAAHPCLPASFLFPSIPPVLPLSVPPYLPSSFGRAASRWALARISSLCFFPFILLLCCDNPAFGCYTR